MEHPNKTPFGRTILTALFTATLLVSAQSLPLSADTVKKDTTKPKAQGLPVNVVTIEPKQLQLWKQYSGSLTAVHRAQIRPQVSGRITDILFKDGQHVNKGDVLIVIDPRPYKAAVKQAQATLATAKTQAIFAKKELDRAKKLVKKQAVSERLLDQRNNNYHVANASVLNAEAQVETAEINIDYAYIKAPISGKVSRAEITEGNLVQSGVNAPLLTTIVANNQVYVDFEIDEATYIASIHKAANKDLNNIPVEVSIGGTKTMIKGFIHSFDNQIDPATGTMRARALFKNTANRLLPGMTVSIKMGLANSLDRKQILLSERAIGTDQDRKFVFLVNKDNKATYREVTIGQSIKGQRVILSGLGKGDVVITGGLMRIRPNMPVSPTFNDKDPSQKIIKQSNSLKNK